MSWKKQSLSNSSSLGIFFTPQTLRHCCSQSVFPTLFESCNSDPIILPATCRILPSIVFAIWPSGSEIYVQIRHLVVVCLATFLLDEHRHRHLECGIADILIVMFIPFLVKVLRDVGTCQVHFAQAGNADQHSRHGHHVRSDPRDALYRGSVHIVVGNALSLRRPLRPRILLGRHLRLLVLACARHRLDRYPVYLCDCSGLGIPTQIAKADYSSIR